MSHKDGRVVLSAWVDPVLRDYAREAAKVANLEFSRWVERAVRQTMAREYALLLGMVAAGEITPPAADRIAWSHGHVEPKAEDLAAIIAGVKLG